MVHENIFGDVPSAIHITLLGVIGNAADSANRQAFPQHGVFQSSCYSRQKRSSPSLPIRYGCAVTVTANFLTGTPGCSNSPSLRSLCWLNTSTACAPAPSRKLTSPHSKQPARAVLVCICTYIAYPRRALVERLCCCSSWCCRTRYVCTRLAGSCSCEAWAGMLHIRLADNFSPCHRKRVRGSIYNKFEYLTQTILRRFSAPTSTTAVRAY